STDGRSARRWQRVRRARAPARERARHGAPPSRPTPPPGPGPPSRGRVGGGCGAPAAADLAPAPVLARLPGATAAGLVEEGAVPGRFRFAHALVRETLSADLLPLARARLHLRVAAVLETLHGD